MDVTEGNYNSACKKHENIKPPKGQLEICRQTHEGPARLWLINVYSWYKYTEKWNKVSWKSCHQPVPTINQ